MTLPLGGQSLGIVTKTPTGSVDAANQAVTDDAVVWVTGCAFETEHISEEQSDSITSAERAWAIMPVTDAVQEITNANYLRNGVGGRDYKVHGLPAPEYDIDGLLVYYWIICEWQGG
jgi:hypothetical protein